MTHPPRTEVAKQLERLIENTSSREEVAAWAMSILNHDDIRISDVTVLDALKFLGSVDLVSTDRPYLYMETDFARELAKLKS